jgi:hypothetical protein
VDEDDVVTGELFAARTGPANELSVVNDELQVEVRRLDAGVAGAIRRVLDPADPPSETEVTLLYRIEEHRSVEVIVERVAEGGVALELVHPEYRLQALDDVARDVGHDVLGVFERTRDDVVRVAGNVGDEQATAISGGSH